MRPPSSIPTMLIINGFKLIKALCSTLEQENEDALHQAFMIEQKSTDPEVLTFMKELQQMATGKEITECLACHCYYHNLLNHVSLTNMRALAKKGKSHSKLLNAKVASPCASCLFGRAHRKAWRSKSNHKHIKSRDCKVGDECSMDQIATPSPGIVPQTVGKLTKQRYVGSQVSIDHSANYCYVAHLKDFTTAETIKAKKSYERAASNCGRKVRKIKIDNSRFADRTFLEDACELEQQVKFCGAGAHHQNRVSERAIRKC